LKLGFSGLVVDRFGYPDSGLLLENGVMSVVGKAPTLVSVSGRFAYYQLEPFGEREVAFARDVPK
jgi:hypothetical protein